jgi:multimeric flavodoxin WrbA
MQNDMQAVLITASPRKRGNTFFVGSIISKLLTAGGWKVEGLELYDLDFSGCIGCEQCRRDNTCSGLEDDLSPYYSILEDSPLWILGSPVHNYNITSWMKAFIDRLYCYYIFQPTVPRQYSSVLQNRGIKAVVYAVAEQTNEKDFGFAIEAMQLPVEALGIDVVGSYRFPGYFEKTSISKDPETIERFISRFEKVIEQIRHDAE